MTMEKSVTFVLIKPDGINRRLAGSIIRRIEAMGFAISGARFICLPSSEIIAHHCAKLKVDYGMDVYRRNVRYLRKGPVMPIRFEGYDTVNRIKAAVGDTDPATAGRGTIRGDWGDDVLKLAISEDRALKNLVHCSSSDDEAERDLCNWFPAR
jgi:nucleoside-diphosphate kinase